MQAEREMEALIVGRDTVEADAAMALWMIRLQHPRDYAAEERIETAARSAVTRLQGCINELRAMGY